MVHCAALVPHQVARAAFVAGRSHAQRMDEHDGADAWAARDRAKGRCKACSPGGTNAGERYPATLATSKRSVVDGLLITLVDGRFTD